MRGSGRMWQLGEGRELFIIFLRNLLLKIVTFGIYHFWAKTRVRRYLWSHAAFDGERFEYSGKGKELFLGFLKAMVFLVPLALLVSFVSSPLGERYPALGALTGLLFILGALLLTGVASYSARRYLLSRTRWRAIRFGQSGSAFAYAGKMLGHGLFVLITLGLYWPYLRNRLLAYKINHTWFGSEQFAYDGRGRGLLGRFALTYLLTIPTLGLIWFWYLAAEARYVAEHLRLREMRFKLDYTGRQLFWLRFSNLLMVTFTLGVAYPWVILRNFGFLFDHLTLAGEPDYAAIAQSAEAVPRSGEGLGEIFGVSGRILGLGRI